MVIMPSDGGLDDGAQPPLAFAQSTRRLSVYMLECCCQGAVQPGELPQENHEQHAGRDETTDPAQIPSDRVPRPARNGERVEGHERDQGQAEPPIQDAAAAGDQRERDERGYGETDRRPLGHVGPGGENIAV